MSQPSGDASEESLVTHHLMDIQILGETTPRQCHGYPRPATCHHRNVRMIMDTDLNVSISMASACHSYVTQKKQLTQRRTCCWSFPTSNCPGAQFLICCNGEAGGNDQPRTVNCNCLVRVAGWIGSLELLIKSESSSRDEQ